MRTQLLSMTGILVLSFTAEKCRQLVGEEHSSRSWAGRFTFTNCFDMSYGSMACILKEIIKLYLYYVRAVYVQKARVEAVENSFSQNLEKRLNFERAVETARQEGSAAKKRASRQAKHMMGPIVSAAWDLFETLYFGGTAMEGIARSGGTFVGTYTGGLIGEGNFGWLGFVAGSQLGSWIGGRVGLMTYDVGNGVQYLLQRMPGN